MTTKPPSGVCKRAARPGRIVTHPVYPSSRSWHCLKQRGLCLGLCLALSLTGWGCRSRSEDFLTEDDALRQHTIELESQLTQLRKQVKSQASEIQTLRQRIEAKSQLAGVEPQKLLHVAQMRFERYSGAVDTDGDGASDLIRLYVTTLDDRGRFMPAVGRAVVTLVAIQPQQSPILVAEHVYEPADFDASYRTGFTGTHYTLEVPLPPGWPGRVSGNTGISPAPPDVPDQPSEKASEEGSDHDTSQDPQDILNPPAPPAHEVTAKVTFTDASTGATFTFQQPVKLTPGPTPGSPPAP